MQAQITFDRKELKSNLELLAMAQSPKSIIPIMNYMKLVVKSKNMFLISTSEDLSMKKFIGSSSHDDFAVIIDSKSIISILNKSTESNVILKISDNGVTVLEGLTGEYHFPIIAKPDEFPVFPKMESDVKKIPLNGLEFRKAISMLTRFIGSDESRPFLNGMTLACKRNGLDVVASDSKILGVCKIGEEIPEFNGAIWSKRTVALLHKLLIDVPIIINVSARNTLFAVSNTTAIHARNLEGGIPEYPGIIPNPEKALDTLVVNRTQFIELLDKLSIVSNNIDFKSTDTILSVSANNKETSRNASNKISTERSNNKSFSGTFQAALMIPFLQSMETEKVSMEVYANDQGVITRIGVRNNTTVGLLMCIQPN